MKDQLSSQIARTYRKALGELSLFADLAPRHLDELVQGTCNVIYQKGQAVFRAGDVVSHLHVLVSGQVKLSLSCRRGNERVLELLNPGQAFGQAELFVPRPYLVSATAVKPSHVLAIRRDTLFRVMADDPRISRRVIEILAQRQLETEADLVAQHSWSPGQRLLGYLLELAGPHRDATGETLVTLETSKKVLASRFDMQPETLSRNLRDLSDAGLIVVQRNRVLLRNGEIDRHLLTNPDPRTIDIDSVRRVSTRNGNSNEAWHQGCNRESWTRCGWINGAGRQRALSQRMAKSWLMLEQGLLARQSRLILRQSVNLFDSRLKELEAQTAGTENQATCAELARLWPRYRTLLEMAPNSGDAHKLFAINEEVLDVADQLARGFAATEGTRKGLLVNLAGRGRMLSQRAAKHFMFRQMGIRVASCRSRLDEANAEFSATLGQLRGAVKDAPGLAAKLESSLNLWQLFRSAMEVRNPTEFPQVARRVFRISEDLLNRTDAMVEACVGLPADMDDSVASPRQAN
ncbi:MAG: type IV pili methyl-accepting chemotaxis transducer N-terminal domain-containing protein [Rhodocyclales bacterium]|nr:type IV pili methyl-accepting chemotaxis transducer N-terminal domain-containing protein [Rhodocyclales bacterium]